MRGSSGARASRQGQPVRLAGVQIGVVSDVQLDPKGTILVIMSIEKKYHAPRNSVAAGGACRDLRGSGDCAAARVTEPGLLQPG
jgi:hypothetical protein